MKKAALIFLAPALMLALLVAGLFEGPGVGLASYSEDTWTPPPPGPPPPPVTHNLTVSPAAVCPGESITISGVGASAGAELTAYIQQGSLGSGFASTTLVAGLSSASTGGDGGFAMDGTVPATFDLLAPSPNFYYWYASDISSACYSVNGDPIITTPAGQWSVKVYDASHEYLAAGEFTVLNCSVVPGNTPEALPASLPSTGAPASLPAVLMASAAALSVGGSFLMLCGGRKRSE